jgi:hypothetical protein
MNSASRWNGGDFKYFCEPASEHIANREHTVYIAAFAIAKGRPQRAIPAADWGESGSCESRP